MDSVNGLTLLLYLVQVVIVVITAVVLLMENRQPSKTMAWLLVLGFLPVVGVLLFIFFGKDATTIFLHVEAELERRST